MKVFVLDIVLAKTNSTVTDLQHAQHTLIFINNEELLDLLIVFLSKKIGIVSFPDPTVETDSISKFMAFRLDFHQDPVEHLYTHLEDLSIVQTEIFLRIMIVTPKTFQSRQTVFEVNMYGTEMTTAITPTSWFYIL